MKTIHLLNSFICFALCETLHAVTPAPDGGYAGNNTAEGTAALFSLTSGSDNSGLGFQALFYNTTGTYNTAEGFRALFRNSSGQQNTANGVNGLISNTNGSANTAIGTNALFYNSTGGQNTAVGVQALYRNTAGTNTAIGYQALSSNDVGSPNSAFGWRALKANTSGNYNTAMGYAALFSNSAGSLNTALGDGALYSNIGGQQNTAIGADAGYNITGSGNIDIGNNVAGVAGENNTIRIGDNLSISSGASACYIGGIYGQLAASTPVYITLEGKLGTMTSSRRFKQDIKPMENISEAILSLQPVTFRYKKEFDPTIAEQFGLEAEDVEKVNPALVIRDKEGKPYSVRYDQVNAMLLNEFLKEHRVVQEQGAMIAQLQGQIKALTAGLQKVSAQLALSKPATQMVRDQ